MKPRLIFTKKFMDMTDGVWDYDTLKPFYHIRRIGDNLEIEEASYHEDSDYYLR